MTIGTQPYVRKAEYTDREIAEHEIGQATRSRIWLRPSTGTPFNLSMRFVVNDKVVAVEYMSRPGLTLNYAPQLRGIGIRTVRTGSGGIIGNRETLNINSNEVAVFDTDRTKGYLSAPNVSSVSLFIPFSHVAEKAVLFTDKPIRDTWDWAFRCDTNTAVGRIIRDLTAVSIANIELCAEDPQASRRVLKLSEEAIIFTILERTSIFAGLSCGYSAPMLAGWQVRKAMDIISGSEELPTVSELADRIGISVRAVHAGFQKHIGMTPYFVIRREKLRRVHAEINRGDILSLNQLRKQYGITNMSRFSQEYRSTYGETPIEHIRRMHY